MPRLGEAVNIGNWRGRAAVMACLIALPFLGFMLRRQYPLFTTEAAAGLGILLAVSILLGLVCRGVTFHAVVVIVICACSVIPIQRELARWVELRPAVLAVLLAACFALLMWRLKERFYVAVAVFTLVLFGANLLRIGAPAHVVSTTQAGRRGPAPAHFLYLVLDEHMGPEGLPSDIKECYFAKARIERTAFRWGLTLYPNAHSNYATTFDSLTSAMNGQLLPHRRALAPPPDAFGVHHLDTRAFREAAARQGYALRFLQMRNVDFTGGDDSIALNYDDAIGPVSDLPGGWTDRFRLLVGRYQASDLVFARFKGFFPFRFGLRMTFPMSVGRYWPDWLIHELASAKRPTLFFAHILSPHGPYVYKADGSMRAMGEWLDDQDYVRLPAAEYRERYARYGEQVEFIQSQLNYLFATLNARGLYAPMTVVVHGDHGSRILAERQGLARLNVEGPASVDRFDYSGAPHPQDLKDRFSVLLAAKRGGQKTGGVRRNPASLLSVVPLYTGAAPRVAEREAGAAYLFDGGGKPVQIRIQDYWRP